jgi:hypothetical protein
MTLEMPLADDAADAPDLARDQRRQAFRGFVEDEHVGVGHQRAADGEHLLLAAGQLLAAVDSRSCRRGKVSSTRS